MVSEKDATRLRRFVRGQLRAEPDLSTLTLGILKKRYLAHVGHESLSPEARNYMKQVVQEELIKMQDSDENGSEVETNKPGNKRKREMENDEVLSGSEDESSAKKCRRQTDSSSSELEDNEDCKTGTEESEDEDALKSGSGDGEHDVKKTEPKTTGNRKEQVTSEDSTDEEKNESEQKGNESNCGDSPKEITKKAKASKKEEVRVSDTIKEKESPQSDEERRTDESSDDSKKAKEDEEKKKNDESDSDSSSLPSLEDEPKNEDRNKLGNKKKKTVKKDEKTTGQKDDDKAVVRLKRYISLCGLRPNYKKLLDGCRSVRAKVAVLKKELEQLGVHGQPSIEKCKRVRMKREEAKELAELDVNNIIATQGRSKRRGASAWQEQEDPPSSTYQRTLNSGSDSDEENDVHRGRRRTTDWTNLQGIISDDADSD
ncbi:hypothetical protein Q5P01_017507 [Channa striata]|uniref:Histone chaperone domain-containing protein n=1 Tax=Channa striata TaxID=64152 RepID=A0AA88SJ52_CHASR|nr:hypothetical protein Q5P01_017507 [Channa striata]